MSQSTAAQGMITLKITITSIQISMVMKATMTFLTGTAAILQSMAVQVMIQFIITKIPRT